MLFCSLFLLMACEKETENTSSILHFELKGDVRMMVSLGTSYEEPRYMVTYKNEDVSKNVQVLGSVDVKTVGIYHLDYIYTNADGSTSKYLLRHEGLQFLTTWFTKSGVPSTIRFL